MNFTETEVAGAYLIDLEPRGDDRGFFARMFCQDEYVKAGLDPAIVQMNVSMTRRAGTVRGLHYQREPAADNKVVRCLAGSIYDVCIDLRPASATFLRFTSAELSVDNRRMLYLPEGCAHGFQALTDGAEIMYSTNRRYSPEYATGVRFDDPRFAIEWPLEVTDISAADRQWPDYKSNC